MKPLRARGDDQKIDDLIAQVTTRGSNNSWPKTTAICGRTAGRAARLDHTFHRRRQRGTDAANRRRAGERKGPGLCALRRARFVYTLPKKIEEILSAKPADLRDRHLVRVDTNNLDRITIEAPGKAKTVLARKDQNWTIANQNNQPANAGEVTRLLNTLKNEQVTKFVEDVASDLPKYGLDNRSCS